MFKKIYLTALLLIAFLSFYALAGSAVNNQVTENINYLDVANKKDAESSNSTVQPSLQSSDLPNLPVLSIPSAPPVVQPAIPIPVTGISSTSDAVKKQEVEKEIALQEQREKIEDEKSEDLVDKLMDLNYSVTTPPKKLYESKLSKENKHLPPVYFKSYYLYLAFKAVDNNNLDALRAVLERYDFVNGQNKDGDTLLMHAVETNHINIARVLLAKGAYVNGVNYRGRTSLHYAAALGDPEMVKLLLTMGANKDMFDDKNMTALDYAIEGQHSEVISILSKYINQQNS